MQVIQRARCHGKKEIMRRQVQALKDAGFCEPRQSEGIVFDTYEGDVGEDSEFDDATETLENHPDMSCMKEDV